MLNWIWRRRQLRGVSEDVRRRLAELQRLIQYRFRQPDLLLRALKHRSFLDTTGEDRIQSNERLEFLGDAVLSLVVSEYFYTIKERDGEGILTNLKSTLVSGPVLAAQARKMELGHYLLLGSGELKAGGRERASILEDTFEALIGAVYLDGGVKAAQRFLQRFLLNDAEALLAQKSLKNYKSLLQEIVQSKGLEPPAYTILEESGPDHNKRYLVEVRVNGEVIGSGHGRTKKQAEQRAAASAVQKIVVERTGK
ncbi:MAG: ribonuclease III [bacterium]